MKDPQIWFDENEEFVKCNEPAKSLIENREIKDLNDLFDGVVSLRLFSDKEMKAPFITEEGKELSKIHVKDEDGMKKVVIPIEKNKWVTNYTSGIDLDTTEFEKEEFDKKRDALEKINEIEEELKESTNFDAERTLIFNFKTTEEFNSFSDSINDRENVLIEDTDQMENQILAIIKITSPTRDWV